MNFKEIRNMTISDLLAAPWFKEHYVQLFNACFPDSMLGIDGENHFSQQIGYFKQALFDSKYLSECNSLSVFSSLIDLAYHGLSLEPTAKPQAYITPKKKSKSDGDEKRCVLKITGYGELAMRIRDGAISSANSPRMVYAGDGWTVTNGIPDHKEYHKSEQIIAAYIKITHTDGTVDYKIYTMAEIQEWRKMSDNPDGKPWTGGLTYKDEEGNVCKQPMRGMIETKLYKHALAAYPRMKLGGNTELVTDAEIERELERTSPVDREAVYAGIMSKYTEGDPEVEEGDKVIKHAFRPNEVIKAPKPDPVEDDDPLADDSTNDQDETNDQGEENPDLPGTQEPEPKAKRTSNKATAKSKEPAPPPADDTKVEIVQPEKPKRAPLKF